LPSPNLFPPPEAGPYGGELENAPGGYSGDFGEDGGYSGDFGEDGGYSGDFGEDGGYSGVFGEDGGYSGDFGEDGGYSGVCGEDALLSFSYIIILINFKSSSFNSSLSSLGMPSLNLSKLL
jgi:hypothetical protein